MGTLGFKAYAALFTGGMRMRCIAGGILARALFSMSSMGFLALFVHAGYSYFLAGLGVAVVQASSFLLAPHVSRWIDARGQRVAGLPAASLGMLFLFVLLLVVHFDGPWWLAFACAAFVGLAPQSSSLMRARWSYVLQRGRVPQGAGRSGDLLKMAFSFEGVLDDLVFMLAPSLAVLASARLFPEAGVLFGGLAYVAGMALMLSDTDSEPDVAFMRERSCALEATDERGVRRSNVLLGYPQALVIAIGMVALGVMYGFIDQGSYSLCRELSSEESVSWILMAAGALSAVVGLVYGMQKIALSHFAQLMCVACAVGVLYLPMHLVSDVPSLFAARVCGSMAYAPFLITTSAAVEHFVPPSRVTEGLTWLFSSLQLGLAIGPTLGGLVVDAFGATSSLAVGSACALCIPLLFALASPLLRQASQSGGRRR